MKRKQPQREERRRRLAELNLVEEPKRMNVKRRGCLPFFGSILALGLGTAALLAGPH